MSMRANARFDIKGWDEKPYSEEPDRPKLTRASVTKTYTGDIEAEAHVEYLMMYRGDGNASFVGLHHVTGSVGGRSGSFVLQSSGTYADNTARVTWFVVPGSGTGELAGIRGKMEIIIEGKKHSYALEYALK